MENFNLVIFGATGDLTKRRLIPALYNLLKEKHLQNYLSVCIGRKEWNNEEFREYLYEFIKTNIKDLDEKTWNELKNRIYYYKTDFNDEKGMSGLKKYLEELENKHKIKHNRLYYMATMPENYENIIDSIKKNKLGEEKDGYKRLIIEKPFGYDIKTATKLNELITRSFREEQIYRIDHYLGKETVSNILLFRFTNTIFDPIWNNKYIDHAQIIVSESLGVENRGNYYDNSGVIRDMIQNHLMQILTLITIDCPGKLEANSIRREKLEIIKSIDKKELENNIVLGQYENYKKELNVDPKSITPTFAALKVNINNTRWKGVPFYLRTGKKLGRKEAYVYIKFKDIRCFTDDRLPLKSNEIVIHIQPESDIDIRFNTKKPGLKLDTQKVDLKFSYKNIFGYNTIEAYEKLFSDASEGDLSNFTSWEETKESWKVVDNLLNMKKLYTYKQNSNGPKESDELIRKNNREWFRNGV
ncbi:MAG: glucose-6-phosphate dehydrogenase [Nanoarchaeota archaeon]